jgi:hypothetical protein
VADTRQSVVHHRDVLLDDVPLLEALEAVLHRAVGDADLLGDVDGRQVPGVALAQLEDGAVDLVEGVYSGLAHMRRTS